jgi:hypothetical protein
MYQNCRKGFFKPVNPNKYAGDATKIIYRSNIEHRYMKMIDLDKRIIRWASEEHVIPYVSPMDGRPHRYFIDLVIMTEAKKVFFVELKSYSQTIPPKPNKKGKLKPTEVATWEINNAKWDAAKEFCRKRGAKFLLLTERDLKRG